MVTKHTAYCLVWHTRQSGAFQDLLVDPLKPYADITLQAWDGNSPLPLPAEDQSPIFFCQWIPPEDWLRRFPERLIWIPMWDSMRWASQRWWNRLPKSLRIAAFSNAVYVRAKQAGLPVLQLHFYKNPDGFARATWANGRVLFYWNRTGLMSPEMLEKLCSNLRIDKLLFRAEIDDRIDHHAYYHLGTHIGHTAVQPLSTFENRAAFFEATREANVFIAPRMVEGAGMAFLEAMARGCAVMAYNAPTMNEYIRSGKNGYLFQKEPLHALYGVYEKLARRRWVKPRPFQFGLRAKDQNWQAIAALDVETIGNMAYVDHQSGYQAWLREIPHYAEFVLQSSSTYKRSPR